MCRHLLAQCFGQDFDEEPNLSQYIWVLKNLPRLQQKHNGSQNHKEGPKSLQIVYLTFRLSFFGFSVTGAACVALANGVQPNGNIWTITVKCEINFHHAWNSFRVDLSMVIRHLHNRACYSLAALWRSANWKIQHSVCFYKSFKRKWQMFVKNI